jgi:hypothetical protein
VVRPRAAALIVVRRGRLAIEEADMTLAVVVADDGADDGGAAPLVVVSVVDAVVTRLHAEFGVDRDQLRAQADAAFASFASARVRAFVPILVEKRVRNAYRDLRQAGA